MPETLEQEIERRERELAALRAAQDGARDWVGDVLRRHQTATTRRTRGFPLFAEPEPGHNPEESTDDD